MNRERLAHSTGLIPVPRLDVRVRNRGGTLLVAWATSIFELAGTDAVIWRALDGRRTVLEIAQVVSDNSGASLDDAAQDALGLLKQLNQAHLIEFRGVQELA